VITIHNLIKEIRHFRALCSEIYPDDIQVTPEDKRLSRIGLDEKSKFELALQESQESGVIYDVCRLIQTPRLLKQILRTTFLGHEGLHGEVDFEDVLVANTLRYAAVEAFEFIQNNLTEIRGLRMVDDNNLRKIRLTSIQKKWECAMSKAELDVASAERLVHFLLPCWVNGSSNEEVVLQRIQESYPVDYYHKYLRGGVSETGESDQYLLQLIRNIVYVENNDYVRELEGKLISDVHFSERFERFAPVLLDGRSVRKIATKVFRNSLSMSKSASCADAIAAFYPLWRLSFERQVDDEYHLKWLILEFDAATAQSLEFTNDLFKFWTLINRSNLDDFRFRAKLRSYIVEKVKAQFAGLPENYLRVINWTHPYATYTFCYLFSTKEEGGAGFKPEEWSWLASVMFKALAVDFQKVALHILPFFRVNIDSIQSASEKQVGRDLAVQFFGEHFDDVVCALRGIKTEEMPNSPQRERFSAVQKYLSSLYS
jgi:hypothetical protein